MNQPKLWPEQYANRKVQEHDAILIEMERRIAALEKAREPTKRPGRPKKQTIKTEGASLAVKKS
jgi:hypothetical protein